MSVTSQSPSPRYYGNRATDPAGGSDAVGSLYYNTVDKVFKYYGESGWTALGAGGGIEYTSPGTTNFLPKFDGTGFVNSAISDDGTTVLFARKAQINSSAIGNVPLTVNGFSGQAVALFQGKVNGGSNVFEVTKDGYFLATPGSSASAPSYSFAGDTNTGMSSFTADSLFFTTGGSTRAVIDAGGITLGGNGIIWRVTPSGGGNQGGIGNHATGVIKTTDGGTGIRGFSGGGASVASAAALPLPTGRVFHVTGTTNITSITSTNFQAGVVITLIFDDVLTVVNGNNITIGTDFITTAGDVLVLAYDGTAWYQQSRAVN